MCSMLIEKAVSVEPSLVVTAFYLIGSACKGKVDIKPMDHCDFYNWENWTSLQKLKKDPNGRPYLSDMVQVIAERGHYKLMYKTSFSEKTTKSLDFLMNKMMKKKQILKNVACLDKPRGFAKDKQEVILKQLDTLLPENRKRFWQNLPTIQNDEDLEETSD
ncbi:hypothetical protein FQR65_LT13787 [Abscondita terminalis]|nr:hypothetical protein FQR65_LT13787 [Abscondita terminalis]